MGTGASTTRQQWNVADEENSAVQSRPSTVGQPVMTGFAKVVEAKNRFMKSREKNTACFQKQVLNFDCCLLFKHFRMHPVSSCHVAMLAYCSGRQAKILETT